MNCLVCVGAASRIACEGPWEERDCPVCGHYRVEDDLVLSLMDQGQIFDVEKTRTWIIRQRKNQPIPCIGANDALLLK